MESISGNFNCDCGKQFEWKTFFLQPGEAVFGYWDHIQKNVVRKDITNNQYHITIRCPECNRSYFITKKQRRIRSTYYEKNVGIIPQRKS